MLAIGVRGQIGERYLYLPMAGIALAVASAVPARRWIAWSALPVVLCWFTILQHRVPEWRDDLSLFSAALEDHPSGFTLANLGHEVNIRSEGTEACALFRAALADEPPYVDVCENAVACALKRGDLREALLGAELSYERCPVSPRLAGLQGSVYLQSCDHVMAAEVIEGVPWQEDARLPLVRAALALEAGGAHPIRDVHDHGL